MMTPADIRNRMGAAARERAMQALARLHEDEFRELVNAERQAVGLDPVGAPRKKRSNAPPTSPPSSKIGGAEAVGAAPAPSPHDLTGGA